MLIPPPPLRMLIVDDDALIREAVETLLFAAFEGAEFVSAVDGADGLERCLTESFDVIITDLQMPRLNGIEMLACARKNGIRTPAIVASGSELPPGGVSRALPFTYISKSELNLLPLFIRKLLGRRADRMVGPMVHVSTSAN